MTPLKLQALFAWLDELERLGERIKNDPQKRLDFDSSPEMVGIASAVLGHVRTVVDFAKLEQKLRAERTLNLDSMRWLIQWFKDQGLGDVGSERAVDYDDPDDGTAGRPIVSLLDAELSEFERLALDIQPDNIAFSLELWGDSLTGRLLREVKSRKIDTTRLREQVGRHLLFLSADDLRRVAEGTLDPLRTWARRIPELKLPSFNAKTRELLATQIADYLVDDYPASWLSAFEAGATSVPHLPFGVLRILSWSPEAGAVSITGEERLLLYLVARLADFFWLSNIDIAALVGVDADDSVMLGRSDAREKRRMSFVRRKIEPAEAVRDLRGLLRTSTLFEPEKTSIEDLFYRFKLAHEIRCADLRKDWADQDEQWHQRNIAHALTLHGVRLYGVKLGSSQPDFLVRGELEYYIEVKKCRSVLNKAQFESYLSQLLSYLDEQPFVGRGVLLILNFSNALITPTKEWIAAGRILVVTLNLLSTVPSKRKSAIAIERSTTGKLFDWVETTA